MKARRPLQIRLLGTLECRQASGSTLRLTSRKSRALLAYLAARPGQRHSRDALSSLLWGDMGDARARANLRQELSVLHRELGEHADALVLDGTEVSFDRAGIETDLAAFERGATAPAENLDRVVELYGGEFLEGFDIPEAPFEAWLSTERGRLRALVLELLERWLTASIAADRYETALDAGRRALALDPVRESVHRLLMQAHARHGERATVARQYRACVDALKIEVGVTPDAETTALYQRLMTDLSPAPAPAPGKPARRPSRVAGARRETSPFVGRDAEMAALSAIRDQALGGEGRVLVVVGEAGIGKTRLVDELLAPVAARGARVITGHCYPSDEAFALSAWIDALRAVGDDEPLLASVGAPWRTELAVLVPEPAADATPAVSGGPRRLFEAVGRLVDRLAAAAPLALVLEDLHWADDTTVRLFAFVARRIAHLPVLMMATARDEEPAYRERLQAMKSEIARAGLLESHGLGPLSRRDADALAVALRREAAPATASTSLDVIWRTSEGNPLAVVEAVRAAAEGAPTAANAASGVPELVRTLIHERLARLSDAGRRVLEMAAVIGRTFELPVLRHATGLSEADVLDQLGDLVHRRLLDDRPDGIDFCHERIREVARETIIPSRRRTMHATVAEAIMAVYAGRVDEHIHPLAVHWREAEVWDRAVSAFHRAGQVATKRGAVREALGCCEEALAALERMPDGAGRVALAIDVRLAYGQLLIPLADDDRMDRYVREAEALCERLEDPRRLANVLALGARHAITWRDPPALLVAAERVNVVATQHGDAEQVGDAQYLVSLASYFVGDVQRAVTIARDVIAHGLDDTRPGALFTAPRQVLLRAVLARGLAELGEFGDAGRVVDEAIFAAGRGTYAQIVALVAQGSVCLQRHDAPGAVRAFARAADLGREAGFGQFDIPARAGAAIGRARQGAVIEAIAELEQIRDELREPAKRLWITLPAIWLAEAYLRADRAVEARTQAEAALRLARARGERVLEGWTQCLLGDIASHPVTFSADEGHAAYAAGVTFAEAGGLRPLHAHCALGLARLYTRAGRDDVARGALARANEMFATLGLPRATLDALSTA